MIKEPTFITMDRINTIAIFFLLAFGISSFVFVAQLFKDQKEQETKIYKVKVRENNFRNFII